MGTMICALNYLDTVLTREVHMLLNLLNNIISWI